MSAFEVLTMGRVGVDLYPLQAGLGLDQVETFGKWLGGSPTNVAVAAAIRDAGVFWVTGTGLSEEPSRSATLAALEARDGRGITVLDLDYRPMFWPSPAQARYWAQQALRYVSVVVGNLDEVHMAEEVSTLLTCGTRENTGA